MKHYLLYGILAVLAFGVLASTSSATSVSFDDGTTWNCNQLFEPKTIRYAYYYDFWDNFTNKNQSIYTNYLNSYAVQFKNGDYLSQGQKCANGKPFCWTTELRDAGFAVAPKQTMKVLSTYSADWRVVRHPTSRTIGSNYDFMIAYKIDYDTSNNYPDASDDTSHVECQPYQVSWCGDGTVDSSYETCDAGIDNGMPGKCNVSCNGVNPPESNTCDKTFPPVVLRYWTTYKFFDEYTNNDSFSHFLRSFNAQFIEPFDYNNSPVVPSFDWTSSLNAVGNIVPAGASKVRIIEATNDYMIRSVPPVRNSDNLMIKYRVYVQNIAGGNLVSHLECQPYEISWCGDGILDTNIQIGPGQYYTEPCDPAAEPWKSNGTCHVDPADGSRCQLVTGPVCGDGIRNGSESCDPNDPAQVGWGPGGCSSSCYALLLPSCGDGFRNGSESCDPNDSTHAGWGTNGCDASCNPVNTPSGFDLSIKKYVNSAVSANDAQNASTAISLNQNDTFNYIIRVRNDGPQSTTRTTTIKDVLPTGIESTGVLPSGTNWSCSYVGKTLTCTSSQSIAALGYFPDITVPVRVTAGNGTITNYTVVYNPDESNACLLDGQIPTGNETICSRDPKNIDPAVIQVGTPGPGIAIDKRDANPLPHDQDGTVGNDTQTVNVGSGAIFRIRVTNAGTENLTNIHLIDALAPNCSGAFAPPATRPSTWSNFASGGLGTHTNNLFEPGEWFEYTCTRDNTAAGGYTNSATVTASGATSGTSVNATDTTVVLTPSAPTCGTAGGWTYSASDTDWGGRTFCNPGTPSPNPPVFPGVGSSVSWTCNGVSGSSVSCNAVRSGGGGGASFVGKKCVNNIATCSTYNSIFACTGDGIPFANCYSADSVGVQMCQSQYLDCGGGGGGSSSCGDGVLQPAGSDHIAGNSDDEECDVVFDSSVVDPKDRWCTVSCKLNLNTNPGENAIDTWITVPTLSNVRLAAWDNKVAFRDYRVVIGAGTKVFTLADVVAMGIKRDHIAPIMFEYDKLICLDSQDGQAITPNKVCTTFGSGAELSSPVSRIDSYTMKYGNIYVWTRPLDRKKFVILGSGDFQYQTGVAQPYRVASVTSADTISLFKGAKSYINGAGGYVTLHNAFEGKDEASKTSEIWLATLNEGSYYQFDSFQVRTSSALIGTTSTPVNRSIESFINRANSIRTFLDSIRSSTSLSTTTTSTSTTNISPVTVNIQNTTADITARSVSDIPMLNGNPNIRAIKGKNLTIKCPTGSNTFVMTGVTTVLVEGGDLIFECNTAYQTGDANASWAWIVKGGNIKVYNGAGTPNVGAVTNLAGVYVAIKDSSGGAITSTGAATTQAILKIDGSLYGDASTLFSSRLYVRGTNAYDILTTGTVITYSNRALVNPPPLLSQYLNNYSVQRVVR